MTLVQLVDQLDTFSVTGLGDVVRMGMEVFYGVFTLRKDRRTLRVGRQKGGAPVFRAIGCESAVIG